MLSQLLGLLCSSACPLSLCRPVSPSVPHFISSYRFLSFIETCWVEVDVLWELKKTHWDGSERLVKLDFMVKVWECWSVSMGKLDAVKILPKTQLFLYKHLDGHEHENKSHCHTKHFSHSYVHKKSSQKEKCKQIGGGQSSFFNKRRFQTCTKHKVTQKGNFCTRNYNYNYSNQ